MIFSKEYSPTASDKFIPMYKGFAILRDNPYLPIAVKKIQKATRNLQLWKFYLIRKYGQRKSFSFGKFPKTYFRKSPIIFSRNILSRKQQSWSLRKVFWRSWPTKMNFQDNRVWPLQFRNTLGTLFAGLFATGVLKHLVQLPIQQVFKKHF